MWSGNLPPTFYLYHTSLHIPDAQIKHPTTVQDQDSSEANPSIKGTREWIVFQMRFWYPVGENKTLWKGKLDKLGLKWLWGPLSQRGVLLITTCNVLRQMSTDNIAINLVTFNWQSIDRQNRGVYLRMWVMYSTRQAPGDLMAVTVKSQGFPFCYVQFS